MARAWAVDSVLQYLLLIHNLYFMTIRVDKELCIGCGTCSAMCPDVFAMDADGKSEVISQENMDCARNAASACPTQAIKLD